MHCIWQRRYWEHQIRSDKDDVAHMDYVHINPVKHGLVQSVKDCGGGIENGLDYGDYEMFKSNIRPTVAVKGITINLKPINWQDYCISEGPRGFV